MFNSIMLKDEVLALLNQELDLQKVNVVNAYERKNVTVPVKKTLISVGVLSENISIDNNKTTSNITDDVVSITIDIFTPLCKGGEYLSKCISNIKTIVANGFIKKNVKIKSSEIKYISNAMAYSSTVVVTASSIIKHSGGGDTPVYDNIMVVINGSISYVSKIFFACNMQYYQAKSYGETVANINCLKDKEYKITVIANKPLNYLVEEDNFTIFCKLSTSEDVTYFQCKLLQSTNEINSNGDNLYKYIFSGLKKV